MICDYGVSATRDYGIIRDTWLWNIHDMRLRDMKIMVRGVPRSVDTFRVVDVRSNVLSSLFRFSLDETWVNRGWKFVGGDEFRGVLKWIKRIRSGYTDLDWRVLWPFMWEITPWNTGGYYIPSLYPVVPPVRVSLTSRLYRPWMNGYRNSRECRSRPYKTGDMVHET